ncbi:MAG: methyltransferase domain-containing protein [Ruminococcaceae bacterium]|nr:methyltransferase domain-containing protein [Oscillospiraceae bacterium]
MILNNDERINEINENLKLIEKKDGLVFGTDAYLLSAILPSRSRHRGAELGAGTGVVSLLALTKKKCAHIYGIEVQESFAELCKRNATLNSLDASFTVINKNVRDITSHDTEGELDFVFSNPPYMKSTSGKANESVQKNIARHEIEGDISDFCACAKRLLKHGGDFYVVYRPDRLSDLIFALKSNNLEPKRLTFIYPNSTTPPCLLLISAKLGAKSGMIVDEPIFIYRDGTNEYTERYAQIYEKCSLELEK